MRIKAFLKLNAIIKLNLRKSAGTCIVNKQKWNNFPFQAKQLRKETELFQKSAFREQKNGLGGNT